MTRLLFVRGHHLPEWVQNRPMSVHRNSRQCEDAYIDAQHLDERTEGAHEVGQVPPLQQRRLELWKQN